MLKNNVYMELKSYGIDSTIIYNNDYEDITPSHFEETDDYYRYYMSKKKSSFDNYSRMYGYAS